MTAQALIIRYVAFAIVATVANLGVQRLTLMAGNDAKWFILAMCLGTLTGLGVKFILDKHWIFFDRATGIRANSRQFVLYAAMGLLTTAIFWITETLFWVIWNTHMMRELGAVIGLMIGYTIKYNLDRRFVFGSQTTGSLS